MELQEALELLESFVVEKWGSTPEYCHAGFDDVADFLGEFARYHNLKFDYLELRCKWEKHKCD